MIPHPCHSRQEALDQIADLDATLSMLRASHTACPHKEKSRWWHLIQQSLDERLILMAIRDEKTA